MKLKPINN